MCCHTPALDKKKKIKDHTHIKTGRGRGEGEGDKEGHGRGGVFLFQAVLAGLSDGDVLPGFTAKGFRHSWASCPWPGTLPHSRPRVPPAPGLMAVRTGPPVSSTRKQAFSCWSLHCRHPSGRPEPPGIWKRRVGSGSLAGDRPGPTPAAATGWVLSWSRPLLAPRSPPSRPLPRGCQPRGQQAHDGPPSGPRGDRVPEFQCVCGHVLFYSSS